MTLLDTVLRDTETFANGIASFTYIDKSAGIEVYMYVRTYVQDKGCLTVRDN